MSSPELTTILEQEAMFFPTSDIVVAQNNLKRHAPTSSIHSSIDTGLNYAGECSNCENAYTVQRKGFGEFRLVEDFFNCSVRCGRCCQPFQPKFCNFYGCTVEIEFMLKNENKLRKCMFGTGLQTEYYIRVGELNLQSVKRYQTFKFIVTPSSRSKEILRKYERRGGENVEIGENGSGKVIERRVKKLQEIVTTAEQRDSRDSSYDVNYDIEKGMKSVNEMESVNEMKNVISASKVENEKENEKNSVKDSGNKNSLLKNNLNVPLIEANIVDVVDASTEGGDGSGRETGKENCSNEELVYEKENCNNNNDSFKTLLESYFSLPKDAFGLGGSSNDLEAPEPVVDPKLGLRITKMQFIVKDDINKSGTPGQMFSAVGDTVHSLLFSCSPFNCGRRKDRDAAHELEDKAAMFTTPLVNTTVNQL